MILADKKGWSLAETKRRISSREFVLWHAFYDWQKNSFHRQDYFLAQIAQEVRRVLHSKPKNVKLEEFLLQFQTKDEAAEVVEESIEIQDMRSKMFWMALVAQPAKPMPPQNKDKKKQNEQT